MTLEDQTCDRRQVVRLVGGPEGLHVILGLGTRARLRSWSPRALEVVTAQPLRPGAHLTVRLRAGQRHWAARGMILRCWVQSLTHEPLFSAVVLLDDDPTSLLGY